MNIRQMMEWQDQLWWEKYHRAYRKLRWQNYAGGNVDEITRRATFLADAEVHAASATVWVEPELTELAEAV